MRTALASLVMLAPLVAHADGAVEELAAGTTEKTPSTPATHWVSDKLAAIYEPTESWQLRLDLVGTRTYTETQTDSLIANLGVEFDPDDSWSLRLVGGFSPAATSTAPTTVQVMGPRAVVDADAQLDTTAGSKSAAAWIGYDTAGDGDFPTATLVTATVNDFAIQQQITSVTDRMGQTVGVDQVQAYCASHTCSPQLLDALGAQTKELRQLAIEGSVTQTLWRDTDVGIGGAYYAYDTDPMQFGYVSVGTLGRTTSFGGGAPVAPLELSIMPSLVHRFGDLMVMTSATYGRYMDGYGYDIAAALRVQYKLKLGDDRRLKLYGKLGGAHDVVQGSKVRSGQAALGVQFMW